jgi:6-phosphofructokinase 2
MTKIYTLTLAPRSIAQRRPRKCTRKETPLQRAGFEPGGGGINVARAITFLGGKATAIFPAGGATGEHLTALLTDEQVPVEPVETQDWTRQNLHVHVAPAANNIVS